MALNSILNQVLANRKKTLQPETGQVDMMTSNMGLPPTMTAEPPIRAFGNTGSPTPTLTPTPTLKPGYGFDQLATYEQQQQKQLNNQIQQTLAKRRADLASSLTSQGTELFKQANPGILEDLNTRGLFTSPSGVNQAQTDALKQIALAGQGQLNEFDNAATSADIQGQQNVVDTGLDLRRSQLESQLQQSQSAQDQALARQLADKQSKNQLTNSLIGVGGQLGSSLLAAKLMGLGKAGGAAAAAAGAAGAGGAGAAGAAGAGGAGAGGAGAAGAGGIGLGGAAGLAAAGIGAMALDKYTTNKLDLNTRFGNTGGAATRFLINPVGSELNLAKDVIKDPRATISKALGKSGGKDQNTNAIAPTAQAIGSQLDELRSLKAARDSGQITPQDYADQSLPIIQSAHQNVNAAVTRGNKWASAINPLWQVFQNEGFAKAQNGKWVSDTGQVFWG